MLFSSLRLFYHLQKTKNVFVTKVLVQAIGIRRIRWSGGFYNRLQYLFPRHLTIINLFNADGIYVHPLQSM